jgi:L-alanine-DL-glutamate epimerase-like enolase superfamily enzyme
VPPTPEAALAALPLVVDRVACEVGAVRVPSYLGAARPTSEVRLSEGRGECVAWTAEAHAGFRARMERVPRGRWELGRWAAAMREAFSDPYQRAALEAAAIDAALRQAGTTLLALAGVAPRPVRYVVSFERLGDPVARARAEAPGVELKVDADPDWDDATWAALAALGRVAVLDFKGAGNVERAHRALPEALIEDPGPGDRSPSLARRLSLDAPVTSAAALDALPARPAAVNLKPARMGGVLEALTCATRCREQGIAVYIGGMFEVGVGREQLRVLAALVSPDGPNDIAPLVTRERPARLPPPAAAAGFACDR